MSAVHAEIIHAAPLLRNSRERRRNRRIAIEIDGRFLDLEGKDHLLKTLDLSCSGALVHADERPAEGADLVCYFSELGRIATKVVRHTPNGFALHFMTSEHKKYKLADRLTWLLNRDPLGLEDDRAAPRYAASGSALVTREDGALIQCRVVDMSLTGASFETNDSPPYVGEHVKAGNLMGEVMRSSRSGFAIRFECRGAMSPAFG